MSGIAGIVHLDGTPPTPGLVRQLCGFMAHRGRDGHRVWSQGQSSFGFCQNIITPSDRLDRQPLEVGAGGSVMVFHGRIDNRDGLADQLGVSAASLRNSSDSDLVAAAFTKWGTGALSRMDGDFTLAFWDAATRSLSLARDRAGIKPLFYTRDGHRIVFCSEVRPLLSLPWIRPEIDEDVLIEQLAQRWISRETTFWCGLKRVQPAHWLRADADGLTSRRYWCPTNAREIRYKHLDSYAEHYRDILTRNVRAMSRSEAPVFCDVSGGLDSAGVYATAHVLDGQGQFAAPAFVGANLNFKGVLNADEASFVDAIERHLGRDILRVRPSATIERPIADIAEHHAVLPPYPNWTMLDAIFDKASGQGSRVVLDGIGGDEWLSRADNPMEDAICRRDLGATVAQARNISQNMGLGAAIRMTTRGALRPLLPPQALSALYAFRHWRAARRDLSPYLTPAVLGRLASDRFAEPAGRNVGRIASMLAQLQDPEKLVNFEMTEQLAALRGVETRSPYYARESVEFAFAVDPDVLNFGGFDKGLHRHAFRGDLPDLVLNRTSKASFESVMRQGCRDVARRGDWQSPVIERGWSDPDRLNELMGAALAPNSSGSIHWLAWGVFAAGSLFRAAEKLSEHAPTKRRRLCA